MRIVLVEPDLVDNGALRVSLSRAEAWASAGDQVTLLVLQQVTDEEVTTEPPRGVAVRYVRRRPGGPRALPLVLGLLRAVSLAGRADVVVSGREIHYGLLTGFIAARIARRPFSVLVQSRVDSALATYVSPRLRGLTRRALAQADLAACVSAGLVPSVVGMGLPAARAAVVHNAIDREQVIAAAALPSEVEVLPKDQPLVVASGRLVPQKGFDLLLRAHAAVLAGGGPAHRLLLVGDGPERAALERLADSLGVGGSVMFAGFVANPHPLVARADLLVCSSRWEGFSLVLLEALALRTPCIAFDCVAGPSEVLEGGAFGRLVPAGDVEAMAAAIAEHLRDPAVLRTKADAGSDPSRAMFQPLATAKRHRDLLAHLVRRRQ